MRAHDINWSNDARTCPCLNRHLTSSAACSRTTDARLGRGGERAAFTINSMLVILTPCWSYSLHVGRINSMLVIFTPCWSYSLHVGHINSMLVILTLFLSYLLTPSRRLADSSNIGASGFFCWARKEIQSRSAWQERARSTFRMGRRFAGMAFAILVSVQFQRNDLPGPESPSQREINRICGLQLPISLG